MEAYRIDRFGSVDGIVLRSSEDLRPGLREVLMRVRASSLNYRDLMVLKGGGRGPTKHGVVPLSDGAGEVAAIGDGVTRVKLGDRIAGRASGSLGFLCCLGLSGLSRIIVGETGIPFLEKRAERAIERAGSGLQQQVRTALRPLHLLTFGEALDDDGVHR